MHHQQSHSSHNNNFSFSPQLFSTLTHLLSLNQTQKHSIDETLINQIKNVQAQNLSLTKYEFLLLNFIKQFILNLLTPTESDHKNPQTHPSSQPSLTAYQQSFRAFLNYFSQTKTKINNLQEIVNSSIQQSPKFIICEDKKLYNLKEELNKKTQKNHKNQQNFNTNAKYPSKNKDQQSQSYKAYVIYGKAINVERQKKGNNNNNIQNTQGLTQLGNTKPSNPQDLAIKQDTVSNLQYTMSLMYEQQKLAFSKCEPNELDDLLLTHYLQDSSLMPILVTNEVYKYFIPLEMALILILPEANLSQGYSAPFIFRDTLLHVYLDHMKILSKTVHRQSYYKNSNFRGICFVEEGQVETKSGRIVARGWVINGKCKSTTYVWKFTKIMTFFKFILHNQNIWKQFLNDLKLNNQWPIKVSDVLNLDQKVYEEIMGQESQNFKLNHNNPRNKKLKFPPISGRLNKSFDINKLNEIQKMKHFDQKYRHLQQMKHEVLKKKIQLGTKKMSLNNKQNHSLTEVESKQMNKKIHILSQKLNLSNQKTIKTDVSRSLFLPPGQSPANILITGIVQKLKSIHESSSAQNNSGQKSPRDEHKRKILEINRSRTKILGLKRYEQNLRYEKNHLYKGKNYYN